MHRWEAKHGNPAPLYDWFREEGLDDVTATVLEKLPTDASREQLGEREKLWVARLCEEGYDLLNVTAGGLGMPGHRWTDEQRQAISERVKQQDIGHLWKPESIAKATAARTGVKRGPYRWADVSKQAASGAKAAHNRWHVGRGIRKDDCTYCSP